MNDYECCFVDLLVYRFIFDQREYMLLVQLYPATTAETVN
jgi:hypothetical protein